MIGWIKRLLAKPSPKVEKIIQSGGHTFKLAIDGKIGQSEYEILPAREQRLKDLVEETRDQRLKDLKQSEEDFVEILKFPHRPPVQEPATTMEEPVIIPFKQERVLCFSADLLDTFGRFQGVLQDKEEINRFRDTVLADKNLFYVDRDKAENDPTIKQLIPYSILRRNEHVFRYLRAPKGAEARLHGLWSIGVGGHINPVDGDPGYEAYARAFARELAEEVGINKRANLDKVVGLINDDSNDVGKVHFGIVHEIEVGFELQFEDDALSNGSFQHPETHKLQVEKYENWSKLIIEHIL